MFVKVDFSPDVLIFLNLGIVFPSLDDLIVTVILPFGDDLLLLIICGCLIKCGSHLCHIVSGIGLDHVCHLSCIQLVSRSDDFLVRRRRLRIKGQIQRGGFLVFCCLLKIRASLNCI